MILSRKCSVVCLRVCSMYVATLEVSTWDRSTFIPTPGLNKIDGNKSDDQGDAGQHFKIYQRFERDASNLGHVGHAGDAVHHRAEDDRRDEHADRLDEGVAQRLHLGAET